MDIAQIDRRRAARLLFQLPRECRVYTAINPAAQWGWNETFANRMNYLLEIIIWQNATPQKKGQMAQHKQRKPKLFMPDFMKRQAAQQSGKGKDTPAMTVDDVKSILALPRGV